jgi:hypothetical protein
MQNQNCKITRCPTKYAQGYYDTPNLDALELDYQINYFKSPTIINIISEKENDKKKNSSRRL